MTETEKYNVILSPQIRMGHDPDQVAKSFAELFKISTEKAGAIIGTKRVLKKGVDLPKAKNYQRKLESIGLNVLLEKMGAAPKQMRVPAAAKPNGPALELVPTEEEQNDKSSGSGEMMVCPKCRLKQPKSAECIGCGVFIHKVMDGNPPPRAADPMPQVQLERSEPKEAAVVTADGGSSSMAVYLAPVGAALLGALLWKFIAVTFNYELGLIAWLVGGAIGFSAAVVGAKGQSTAVVCAVLALLAILGGKYMAVSTFISEASAAVILDSQNISTVDVMMESLDVIDFLFLFLGVGTAYRLGMGTDS